MKLRFKKTIDLKLNKTDEVLGFFGQTQLVRRHTGVHELMGGTEEEQAAARDWCRNFAPEIKLNHCEQPEEVTFYLMPTRRKNGRKKPKLMVFSFAG